jgi:hypothetical protein
VAARGSVLEFGSHCQSERGVGLGDGDSGDGTGDGTGDAQ